MNGRLAAVCALLVWLTVVSMATSQQTAQSQAPSRPKPQVQAAPKSEHPLYQRRGTWYEFMLKQFNPDDVDYGRWFEHRRQAFRDGQLNNPYFSYSLSATIALLLMTMVCAKVWIDHRREMWITAEMMADVYNQDAYSREVAKEAIERYNSHIERCNRAIEAAGHGETLSGADTEIEQLRGELLRVAGERDTATRERDGIDTLRCDVQHQYRIPST